MSKRNPSQEQPTTETTQEVELLSGVRQSSESDAAVVACNDWLRMGPGRSLTDLRQRYVDTNQNQHITGSLATLRDWSMKFQWADRAKVYDAEWEARKNADHEAFMAHGLALSHERLRKLYRLEAMLEAQIYERGLDDVLHNLWVPDVKSIGSGDNAERVDIERFNSAIIEQYRKVLEDIAKETGGRIQKQEVTGANGGVIPILISGMNMNDL